MEIDKKIKEFYKIMDEIPWRSFGPEIFFRYYYAEDRLYIIKDDNTGELLFVEAKSPGDALGILIRSMAQKL